jgi:hypothetical protein
MPFNIPSFDVGSGGSGAGAIQTFSLATADAQFPLGPDGAHYDRLFCTQTVTVSSMSYWLTQLDAGDLQMGIYDAADNLLSSTAVTPISGSLGPSAVALSSAVALAPGYYLFALWCDAVDALFLAQSLRFTGASPNLARFQGGLASLPAVAGGGDDGGRFYLNAF